MGRLARLDPDIPAHGPRQSLLLHHREGGDLWPHAGTRGAAALVVRSSVAARCPPAAIGCHDVEGALRVLGITGLGGARGALRRRGRVVALHSSPRPET